MKTEELIELLREARESLLAQHDPVDNLTLVGRIDAALASHDAVPPGEVAWRKNEHCDDEFEMYEAYPDDYTGLDVVRFKDGKWRWTACREVEEQGYCNTLDEAQRAALSAARGMR